MAEYEVTIPIAGHAHITVNAESEQEAIGLALKMVTLDDINIWEPLKQFNARNVCCCPRPWEAEAEKTE